MERAATRGQGGCAQQSSKISANCKLQRVSTTDIKRSVESLAKKDLGISSNSRICLNIKYFVD